ncbi:MAG: hypothetical protein GY798_31470 [Hyphomicrobiales bacterium]|nr:hypothetical protein [Hyphomicrobiales bacterium]
MDELTTNIASGCGIDPETARTVATIILKFVADAGPADASDRLVDALPGAREAMAASPAGGGSGLIGAFNDLSSAGLSIEQIQVAARSLGDVARDRVGEETVDAIVASVPGLGPFV